MRSLKLLPLVAALALSACATQQPYDYTAFKESDPKSILVLPPLNESPDVNATAGMASAVTLPLAESGYYVFPVAVVEETFKQNGLTNPGDIHDVQLDKLNEIFGADAVLYIKVTEYGTKYQVIQSNTRVSAEAKLVDARTGKELWTGSATASSLERGNNQAGLLGALVQAVVEQIASSVSDRSYDIAQMTGSRLLSAGTPKGILYGPRSPHYHTQHNK
ncbi:DUF799 domain-containing protein [Neisseria zalophi]|uniref:Lipoprotein n=1 Tax=Neisseria zalophi TaxID=640030 RepID=A0A5J6PRU3_9NEIS|nr:DUF799 domain-containing protein [Neisseria zalophi]QEY25349.1 hypothetical protein D0T92_01540 [Neisseria zalophi]